MYGMEWYSFPIAMIIVAIVWFGPAVIAYYKGRKLSLALLFLVLGVFLPGFAFLLLFLVKPAPTA